MSPMTRLLVAGALVVSVAACGGGDDESAPAEPTADVNPERAEASTTDATAVATTDPPTTSTTTTTVPPPTTPPGPVPLVIQHLADVPERGVYAVVSFDGASLVTTGRVQNPERHVRYSLLRFSVDGALVQEAPLDFSDQISEFVTAGSPPAVYGSFWDGNRPNCALRTIDPATFGLGPTVVVSDLLTTGNSCFGPIAADDVAPGVYWHLSPETWFVHRIDAALGIDEAIELPLPLPGSVNDVDVLAGHAFLSFLGDGQMGADGVTASLVMRIDGATLGVTGPVEVGGELIVADGRLLVANSGEIVQELDPATLSPTPLTRVDVEPPAPRGLVAGDGVHWQAWRDNETGDLVVDQLDPGSGRFVGRGRIPTGYDPTVFNQGYGIRSIAIGPDLYVFTSAEAADLANDLMLHSSKLFKVTAAG